MKNRPFRLMFVCMGNICRSPLAHGVFQKLVEERGLQDRIDIESSGTISYHAGELPDPRMRAEAKKHGIELSHRARQFLPEDVDTYDLILGMDSSNIAHIKEIGKRKILGVSHIKLFRKFDPQGGKEVPDPYYGSGDGFSLVYDIVSRTCEQLLEHIEGSLEKTE